jgi:hypothetical protein
LENAEAPASFGLGDIGGYQVSLKARKGTLIYQRKLVFGGKGRLAFALEAYPTLKKVFDAIHEQDQHAVTLRQRAAGAGAGK